MVIFRKLGFQTNEYQERRRFSKNYQTEQSKSNLIAFMKHPPSVPCQSN